MGRGYGDVSVYYHLGVKGSWRGQRGAFPARAGQCVNAKLARQYAGKRLFHPKSGHVASAFGTQPAKQDWAPSLDSLFTDRAWGGHPQLFQQCFLGGTCPNAFRGLP